jgi:hypothetical protein
MFNKSTIEALVRLYRANRQQGHTDLLLSGVADLLNSRNQKHVLIIAGTQQNASFLRSRLRGILPGYLSGVAAQLVSIIGVPDDQFCHGRRAGEAIVFDNYPVMELLASWQQVDTERASLQLRVDGLVQKLEQTVQALVYHVARCDQLQDECDALVEQKGAGNDCY